MTVSNKRIISIMMAVALAMVSVALAGCGKKEEPQPAQTPEAVATPAAVEVKTVEVTYWPFTGLPVAEADKDKVKRRPLSVKIENDPEAWYQSGINSADIVYETRVEGFVSRFNCIFQSNIPNEVGPVRSARLSDTWVVPQYCGILYYSGCNAEVRDRLSEAKIVTGPQGDLFYRVDFKYMPHNLYFKTKDAYKLLKKVGIKYTTNNIEPLYFGIESLPSKPAITALVTQSAVAGMTSESAAQEAANTDSSKQPSANQATTPSAATSGGAVSTGPLAGFTGVPEHFVSVEFLSRAAWEWDAKTNRYLRYTSDKKHLDGATKKQVWTDNVIVLYAEYSQAKKLDPAGNPTYDTDLGGTGDAKLFRDGYMYECTWEADKNSPPKFFDNKGNQIPLKPGKTWIMVPANGETEVKIAEKRPPGIDEE